MNLPPFLYSLSISGIVLPSSKMPVLSHRRTQTLPPSTFLSHMKGSTSSKHSAPLPPLLESGDRPRETRQSQLKTPANHHVYPDSTQLPKLQASSKSGHHSSRSKATTHLPFLSSEAPNRKAEHSNLKLRTDLTAPINPAESSPKTPATVASSSGVTRVESAKMTSRSGEPRSRSKSENVCYLYFLGHSIYR